MKTALVTGVPGWLGTRLEETLLADEWRVTRFAGDVRRAADVEAFVAGSAGATLFHCAGVIHPRRGVAELHAVNVGGTRALLAAAGRAGVARFIYVSSSAAVEAPRLAYGESKRRAEELVLEANQDGRMETVVLRPPWFYGPGQPARQSLFFALIARGLAPIVGSGDTPRAMVYLDNLCQALLLAARVTRARGRAYDIADRRPYSVREIVDTVKRVFERDLGVRVARRQLHLPQAASRWARLADGALQSAGLYSEKLHVLGEMDSTITSSIDAAVRELGYDPRVELEEGIRRSIDWMRQHEPATIARLA